MADVSLSHGNVFGELAQLALESYGSGHPEPFAWQGGGPPVAEALSLARGWQPITAADLGVDPTHMAAASGGLSYEFINGFYQANLEGQPGTANAYVLQGDVNGKATLAIAFRGTDELPGDNADFVDFNRHFAKFAAIDQAVIDYVNDPSHGIEQVLITGQSLGGALADTFMEQDGVRGDLRYKAVTFASPGADLPSNVQSVAEQDPRVLDFAHSQDAVPLAHHPAGDLIGHPELAAGSDAPSALGLLGLATLAADPEVSSLRLLTGLPEDTLLQTVLHPLRTLPGGEAVIAIDAPSVDDADTGFGFGLVEHDPFLYVATMNALIDLAQDPQSSFSGTPLAGAIRAQDPSGGPALDTFASLTPNEPGPPAAPFTISEVDHLLNAREASARFGAEVQQTIGAAASDARPFVEQLADDAQSLWHSVGASDWAFFHG